MMEKYPGIAGMPRDSDIEPEELLPIYDPSELPEEGIERPYQLLDLGPSEIEGFDIGPESKEESEFFDDISDSRYVDKRLPEGVHCMDDRTLLPGIQLPGGIVETWIVSDFMHSGIVPKRQHVLYEEKTEEAIAQGFVPHVHPGCAARNYKRSALETSARNLESAIDFSYEVMKSLDLAHRGTERETERAVLNGAQRAGMKELWDINYQKGMYVAKRAGAVIEQMAHPEHRAAGVRIDSTGNLFNNALFRHEHRIDGEEVGVFSVTPGAYRDKMVELGYRENKIVKEVMHATLFAFGVCKYIGSERGRVGLVTSKHLF